MSTTVGAEPFWMVQSVFDPDGMGGDFAYTIGLIEGDRDELHIWARPSLGDDPGADFRLSNRDMAGFLNEIAWPWLDGTVQVGDVVERELDVGATTIRITIGEPVHPHEVEALGARTEHVVPLQWSLHRPPIGQPVPVPEADRPLWTRRIRVMDALSLDAPSIPLAPRPDRQVTFDVNQPYGPLSAWVAVNARSILVVDRLDAMTDLITGESVEPELSPRIWQMRALARGVARHEQLLAVDRLAEDVKVRLCRTRRWRNEVAAFAAAVDTAPRNVDRGLASIYLSAITSILTASAFEDVLAADVIEPAIGWWRPKLTS